MAEATLQAKSRAEKGKQPAKQMRREGLIPGVLYGPGKEPMNLSVNLKEFVTLLHARGRNVVVDLVVDGARSDIKAFIYEIQHDPISGDIIHVDLKHISLKEKINATVPVQLVGVSAGVKNEGGSLEHIMHTVEISCLPTQIPDAITLDISGLHNGNVIHVRDLPRAEYEFVSEPDSVVVQIVSPRTVEGGPAEGGPAEPEVIGGKKVEE